jgi:hypothetical protein
MGSSERSVPDILLTGLEKIQLLANRMDVDEVDVVDNEVGHVKVVARKNGADVVVAKGSNYAEAFQDFSKKAKALYGNRSKPVIW